MPIYLYECKECSTEVEEIQKMDADPPVECEACGKKGTLEKKMAASSFVLVGSGWAKDGYS
jgi:putative FmdB family regulatory protein